MAPGRAHSIATLTASACFATNGQYLMAAGCFSGLLLTPDLDVDNGSISEYFAAGLGYWPQKIWNAYWMPYRKIMAHRSFLSHFPVVSTIIRIVYLFWWLYFAGYPLPPAFVVGLITSDTIHWMMDSKIFRKVW